MPRCCSISIQSDVGVALRLAAAHRAGQVDRPRVEQQLLGQRGLAGVGMGNDRKRPPAGDLARQRLVLMARLDAVRRGKRSLGVHRHASRQGSPIRIRLRVQNT